MAGPQLIIADYGNLLIRCVNLRSEQVTTLAGDGVAGHVDGVAHTAHFYGPIAVAIAPSGVLLLLLL